VQSTRRQQATAKSRNFLKLASSLKNSSIGCGSVQSIHSASVTLFSALCPWSPAASVSDRVRRVHCLRQGGWYRTTSGILVATFQDGCKVSHPRKFVGGSVKYVESHHSRRVYSSVLADRPARGMEQVRRFTCFWSNRWLRRRVHHRLLVHLCRDRFGENKVISVVWLDSLGRHLPLLLQKSPPSTPSAKMAEP